jgi:protein-disulfide isomerase
VIANFINEDKTENWLRRVLPGRSIADFGDLRYVWRHLPLVDVHSHAQLAAEAAEVAELQDAFWEMHDLLFEHQTELTMPHILSYAQMLGLNMDRFTTDLERHVGAARVASDVDSADLSGVSGTPTFFINGRRHFGAYGITERKDTVRAAHARSRIE